MINYLDNEGVKKLSELINSDMNAILSDVNTTKGSVITNSNNILSLDNRVTNLEKGGGAVNIDDIIKCRQVPLRKVIYYSVGTSRDNNAYLTFCNKYTNVYYYCNSKYVSIGKNGFSYSIVSDLHIRNDYDDGFTSYAVGGSYFSIDDLTYKFGSRIFRSGVEINTTEDIFNLNSDYFSSSKGFFSKEDNKATMSSFSSISSDLPSDIKPLHQAWAYSLPNTPAYFYSKSTKKIYKITNFNTSDSDIFEYDFSHFGSDFDKLTFDSCTECIGIDGKLYIYGDGNDGYTYSVVYSLDDSSNKAINTYYKKSYYNTHYIRDLLYICTRYGGFYSKYSGCLFLEREGSLYISRYVTMPHYNTTSYSRIIPYCDFTSCIVNVSSLKDYVFLSDSSSSNSAYYVSDCYRMEDFDL